VDQPTLTLGCSPGWGLVYIFFITFTLMSTYVTLNLFIAVLLEGFENQMKKDDSSFSSEQFQILRDAWQRFDHDANYFIPEDHFLQFLKDVLGPLGAVNPLYCDYKKSRRTLLNIAKSMKLCDYDGEVYFREVAQALAQMVFERKKKAKAHAEAGDMHEELNKMIESMEISTEGLSKSALKQLQAQEESPLNFTYEERCAARVIQSSIRTRKARREVHEKRVLRDAAIVIQCKFRQNGAKLVFSKISNCQRDERHLLLEEQAEKRKKKLIEKHHRKQESEQAKVSLRAARPKSASRSFKGPSKGS